MKNQKQTKFKSWGVLLIGTLLFVSLIIPQRVGSTAVTRTIPPQINASVLTSMTNQARTQNGLSTLKVNSLLVQAASRKVDDMFQKQYFAHTSPQGLTGWYFLRTTGYSYLKAGENLAEGFITNQTLFSAWMQSSTHRANILQPSFQEIGIATKVGTFQGQTAALTVQFFGIPQGSSGVEPSTEGQVLAEQTTPSVTYSQWTPALNQAINSLNKNTLLISKLIREVHQQRSSVLKILSETLLIRQTAFVK